jgi:site-specific DNA-methyltransferase (cytosine-N4-specific)
MNGGFKAAGIENPHLMDRLTYTAIYEVDGTRADTKQRLLETASTGGGRRQATRYSSHGLHEYKGKFNPQVVKFLLNYYSIKQGCQVLDPFCGSGTTLLEAAHLNIDSVGVDANPLAKLIASTKLALSRANLSKMESELRDVFCTVFSSKAAHFKTCEHTEYLSSWFSNESLVRIELLRSVLLKTSRITRDVGLILVSNQLRQFSLQDPGDLRIRRRSEAPDVRLMHRALENSLTRLISEVKSARRILGKSEAESEIIGGSISHRDTAEKLRALGKYDLVVTSPPYAMALPYIDIQRLSLVWLRMVKPSELRNSERLQIGNREFAAAKVSENNDLILRNYDRLPNREIAICRKMLKSLSTSDGFRRQAVPALMYQYLVEMQQMFLNIRKVVDKDIPFALVVGANRTRLGGLEFRLDTPRHLASIACESGWKLEEKLELDAYQRFGLHATNGISRESLVLLRST